MLSTPERQQFRRRGLKYKRYHISNNENPGILFSGFSLLANFAKLDHKTPTLFVLKQYTVNARPQRRVFLCLQADPWRLFCCPGKTPAAPASTPPRASHSLQYRISANSKQHHTPTSPQNAHRGVFFIPGILTHNTQQTRHRGPANAYRHAARK